MKVKSLLKLLDDSEVIILYCFGDKDYMTFAKGTADTIKTKEILNSVITKIKLYSSNNKSSFYIICRDVKEN